MSNESISISTVGQLRAALDGLPDDRPIFAQVVATNGDARNMQVSLAAHPKFLHWAPVLTLQHPELEQLPNNFRGEPRPEKSAASTDHALGELFRAEGVQGNTLYLRKSEVRHLGGAYKSASFEIDPGCCEIAMNYGAVFVVNGSPDEIARRIGFCAAGREVSDKAPEHL